jgi:hypothetical protein
MTLLEELKKTKDQVLYLLENYPAARNNDFYLQILWLKHFGGLPNLWIEWEKIKENAGKIETVSRVRRKIQNEDKLFLPTDPVIKARREKQRRMREVIKEF